MEVKSIAFLENRDIQIQAHWMVPKRYIKKTNVKFAVVDVPNVARWQVNVCNCIACKHNKPCVKKVVNILRRYAKHTDFVILCGKEPGLMQRLARHLESRFEIEIHDVHLVKGLREYDDYIVARDTIALLYENDFYITLLTSDFNLVHKIIEKVPQKRLRRQLRIIIPRKATSIRNLLNLEQISYVSLP